MGGDPRDRGSGPDDERDREGADTGRDRDRARADVRGGEVRRDTGDDRERVEDALRSEPVAKREGEDAADDLDADRDREGGDGAEGERVPTDRDAGDARLPDRERDRERSADRSSADERTADGLTSAALRSVPGGPEGATGDEIGRERGERLSRERGRGEDLARELGEDRRGGDVGPCAEDAIARGHPSSPARELPAARSPGSPPVWRNNTRAPFSAGSAAIAPASPKSAFPV